MIESFLANYFDFSTISIDPSKLLSAIVVFAAFYILLQLTRKPFKKALEKTRLDAGKISLLVDKIYAPSLFVLAIVASASQLGINVTAALAGMGIIGVGVSFAAKDALGNIIAGFMIYWDRPFKLGDWIEIGNSYGKVTKITLRTTRVKTLDNRRIIVPNSRIVDEVLTNHSKGENVRIEAIVGIGYEEDIKEARKVLLEAVSNIEGVLDEPESDVVVKELGDSSVVLGVRVWVKDESKERKISFEVNEKIKLALDEAGIEMPYPHSVIIEKQPSKG